MPLPACLRLPALDPAEYERFCELCDEIQYRATSGDSAEVAASLAVWNARANEPYEARAFVDYSDATSQEYFVTTALAPALAWIADLTFDEACQAVDAIVTFKLSDAELGYVLRLLDHNLPNGDVTGFIYSSEACFPDVPRNQLHLTAAHIVGYAMARSGRRLQGAPDDLELPYPPPLAPVLLPPAS
jgi:hypothetical protein